MIVSKTKKRTNNKAGHTIGYKALLVFEMICDYMKQYPEDEYGESKPIKQVNLYDFNIYIQKIIDDEEKRGKRQR